jgi:phosphoglycerol transferase MdoB-like AlkP superfamily enzyme
MSCVWSFLFSPGVPGALTAIVIFLMFYTIAWTNTKPSNSYTFEPRGPGSFEPILARYSRLVEFIVGLATSSIVLLAGSSIFRSAGKLPKAYGSPLVLLASSVICAVLFIALCNYHYEEYQHHNNYNHHKYRLNVALGFSGLVCFAAGYLWLGFALVRD